MNISARRYEDSCRDEIIFRAAWKKAREDGADYYNIGCLAEDLAKELGEVDLSDIIKDAIYRALKSNSVEFHGDEFDNVPDANRWGRSMFYWSEYENPSSSTGTDSEEIEIYWIFTNAYNEWYSDKPDWWQDMA